MNAPNQVDYNLAATRFAGSHNRQACPTGSRTHPWLYAFTLPGFSVRLLVSSG